MRGINWKESYEFIKHKENWKTCLLSLGNKKYTVGMFSHVYKELNIEWLESVVPNVNYGIIE